MVVMLMTDSNDVSRPLDLQHILNRPAGFIRVDDYFDSFVGSNHERRNVPTI